MVDKEMLEAMRAMMKEELEPINKRLDKMEQGQTETNTRLNKLETKMNGGFDLLEYSINELSKDVGRISKRLDLHVEQPIH